MLLAAPESRAQARRDRRAHLGGRRLARRPYFDDAERDALALALAEAVARLADHAGGVPDEVWEEAAGHFDEPQLAALVLTIANVNLWTRLNVTTRQVAGQEW